jgi:hypothetical protein
MSVNGENRMYGASTRISASAVRLLAACLIAGSMCAADPSCVELRQLPMDRQVSYLEQSRQDLTGDCIQFAISELERSAYAPGAAILTSYLDFRVASANVIRGEHQVVINHLPWLDEYPAAHALFAIGRAATDSLVGAIASDNASDIIRTNAGEVLLAINRENMAEAVATLTRASKVAPNAVAASRLRDAATRLAQKCPGFELRSACELALN